MTELALVQSQPEADVEEPPDALAPFREGEPPSARDLGISVRGLPPARAMLGRLHGWTAAKRREIASMAEARDRLTAEIEAADRQEQQLAGKTTGLARSMIAAAVKGVLGTVDTGDHSSAVAAAQQARSRAEVAKVAVIEIDANLARLHDEILVIEERIDEQAKRCLIEMMAPNIARYKAAADELIAAASTLAAADAVLGANFPAARGPRIDLPIFSQLNVGNLGNRRDLAFDIGLRTKADEHFKNFRGWLAAWRADPKARRPLFTDDSVAPIDDQEVSA